MTFDESIPKEEGFYWFNGDNQGWEVVRVNCANLVTPYVWSCGWEVPLNFDEKLSSWEWGERIEHK